MRIPLVILNLTETNTGDVEHLLNGKEWNYPGVGSILHNAWENQEDYPGSVILSLVLK